MSTRIFKVEYSVNEYQNGKFADNVSETINIKAKNALEAIVNVKGKAEKPWSYTDDETKKKVSITRKEFDPTSVTLEAESEN